MASLGELFIELGVKADTEALKSVKSTVKGLRTNLLLVGAAFTGAVVGLDRFVNSSLKGVVALQNLNQQTGLSIEKLQKFQQAGQLANLSLGADQIAQSLGNVQRNLAEIRLGGNLAPFQLLGISPLGKDAFQVVEELRGAIQGVDSATATNLISQLGLSPEFINILKLSRKEFEALGQNTFLNKEQRRNIDALGTSITSLKLNFKALKDQAVAKIAPQLNELVQKFFKWLKDNGDKVVSVLSSSARAFSSFASAIGNAFALTGQFLENIMGLENGIKILTVAFTALSLSFSPFLLGLTSVILLLDDLAVYKRGGDSLFGDLIDGFKELPEISKALFGLGGVAIFSSLAKNMKLFSKSLKGLVGIATSLAPITAFLVAATAFANSPAIGEKVADVINKTEAGKKVGDFLAQAKRDFTLSGSSAESSNLLTPYLTSLGALSYVVNNNNDISVNGVQEPERVGAELEGLNGRITTDSLKNLQQNQGNGLR